MSTISLLVVEDHELYARVLVDLLRKDENLQVVAVVPTAEEGLNMLEQHKVDLALVDISLPRTDGIALVRQIRDRYPGLPCLMISANLSPQYVYRALQAGARGYLLKDSYSSILEGIWSVVNGETYISKELGPIDLGLLGGMPAP